MNPISQRFENLRQKKRKALISYIMGGDPNLKTLPKLVEVLVTEGTDLIEIGVPFSDPLADGPVIQAAGQRALKNGVTLNNLLAALKPVALNLPVPLVLMIYYNMICKTGPERFVAAVKAAGCGGLIIPDLPPEEAAEVVNLAREYQLGLNFLVAPTNTLERIRQAAEFSSGFVYAVSLKGVTGLRSNIAAGLPQFVEKVKSTTTKPVAIGFGISNPEQAGQVSELADGVIIGSAIVNAIADDPDLFKLRQFLAAVRTAI